MAQSGGWRRTLGIWWHGLLHEASYALVIAATAAVIGALLIFVRPMIFSLKWPIALFAFVFIFGVVLFAFGQLRTTLEQIRRQRIRSAEPEIIAEILRGWFFRAGWNIRNEPIPEAAFRFVATDRQQRAVIVGQGMGEPHITLGGRVVVSPEHQTSLDAATNAPNSTVLYDMAKELVQFGVEFRGLTIGQPIRAVEVIDRIPLDETLTEFKFAQRVLFVLRAQILLIVLVRRAIGAPLPPQANGLDGPLPQRA